MSCGIWQAAESFKFSVSPYYTESACYVSFRLPEETFDKYLRW